MSGLVNHSVCIYRTLMFLYPEELRREFGNEIVLAFTEDMEAAWRDSGMPGVMRVWWWTLRELLSVAVPGLRSNPFVVVPSLSFALVAIVQGGELCLALHQTRNVQDFMLFDAIRLIVLLPSTLSALVGLVVARIAAHCSIVALQLD